MIFFLHFHYQFDTLNSKKHILGKNFDNGILLFQILDIYSNKFHILFPLLIIHLFFDLDLNFSYLKVEILL